MSGELVDINMMAQLANVPYYENAFDLHCATTCPADVLRTICRWWSISHRGETLHSINAVYKSPIAADTYLFKFTSEIETDDDGYLEGKHEAFVLDTLKPLSVTSAIPRHVDIWHECGGAIYRFNGPQFYVRSNELATQINSSVWAFLKGAKLEHLIKGKIHLVYTSVQCLPPKRYRMLAMRFNIVVRDNVLYGN
jgi:hypothetical protein